jgi:hypothetical protein
MSCQGDPWQLGVTLTWRRCQGQSGLDNVGGQSMQQHAGWQDCLRLASPRQVRHRVRRTWQPGTRSNDSVWPSRETERGMLEVFAR